MPYPICLRHGHEKIGGVCRQCVAEEQERHNRAVEKELEQQRRDAEELRQQQRRDAEELEQDESPAVWVILKSLEEQHQLEQQRWREKMGEEWLRQQEREHSDQVTRDRKVKRQRFLKSLSYWVLWIFGPLIWSTVAWLMYEIVFSHWVPYQTAKPVLGWGAIVAWILAPIILSKSRKIESLCTKCGAPTEVGFSCCKKCGCTKCGAPTEVGLIFCKRCGSPLRPTDPS